MLIAMWNVNIDLPTLFSLQVLNHTASLPAPHGYFFSINFIFYFTFSLNLNSYIRLFYYYYSLIFLRCFLERIFLVLTLIRSVNIENRKLFLFFLFFFYLFSTRSCKLTNNIFLKNGERKIISGPSRAKIYLWFCIVYIFLLFTKNTLNLNLSNSQLAFLF